MLRHLALALLVALAAVPLARLGARLRERAERDLLAEHTCVMNWHTGAPRPFALVGDERFDYPLPAWEPAGKIIALRETPTVPGCTGAHARVVNRTMGMRFPEWGNRTVTGVAAICLQHTQDMLDGRFGCGGEANGHDSL